MIRSVVALVVLLWASVSAAQVLPKPPHQIGQRVLVAPSVPASTDVLNPFGSAAFPRKTIPNPIPAGTTVEILGVYATAHIGATRLKVNGTQAAPVIIRTASAFTRAIVTAGWEVSGSYGTIDTIWFRDSGFQFIAPNDHMTFINNEVTGNKVTNRGFGIASWADTVSVNRHITVTKSWFHDHGDVQATFDQDFHGIAILGRAEHIHISENTLERNSGDGIQINGDRGGQQALHHIFVYDNLARFNKQSGFWTKQASDVVFMRNKSHDHRPSNSSPGACFGGQYGPDHVWWIQNEAYNCDVGIRLASDMGDGRDGTIAVVLDNKIHDIRISQGTFNPGDVWQTCGVSLPGGLYRYVLGNTLTNVDSGICAPLSGGSTFIVGNTVTGLRSNGSATFGTMTPVPPEAKPLVIDYFNQRYNQP